MGVVKQHKSFLLQASSLSQRIRAIIRFPKNMIYLHLLEPSKDPQSFRKGE